MRTGSSRLGETTLGSILQGSRLTNVYQVHNLLSELSSCNVLVNNSPVMPTPPLCTTVKCYSCNSRAP
jgi:hypothetical protein